MIHHRCPVCDALLQHSAATAGVTVACSHCRSPVEVPHASTAGRAVDRAPAASGGEGEGGPIVDRIGHMLGAHASAGAPPPQGVGRRVMYTLLGLFLLTIFGGVGAYGAFSFVEQAASDRWVKAEGQVEGAGVSEAVSRTSRGRRRVEYSARVRYKYSAGGKSRESARVAFGPEQNYSFLAKALADQYRPGQKVTVYYDPARPDKAVLRREVLFGGYLFTVVGAFVGFIGLRLVLVSLAPTVATSNSRWAPWSRRFTWVDLPVTAVGAVGVVLWVPMLFGL